MPKLFSSTSQNHVGLGLIVSIFLQDIEGKYLEIYDRIGTRIQVNCLLR